MDAILNNPLYLGIAIVLIVLIVFSIIKKVLKLTVIAVLLFVAYSFFVIKTSDNPEKTMKKHFKNSKEQIEKVVDEGKKLSKKAEKIIPMDTKKKAEKALKNLIE
ncbi:hypothetical protein KAJ27_17050 [bacterium]|nr:hypothetical protein [Candidatus Neomarinimicrobiota bacterium]MCK5685844.1 hypothetical protein [bacterium]